MYYLKLLPIQVPTNSHSTINFIWVHGWGQNHTSLLNIAKDLQYLGTHWLLDLPGFGKSAPPDLMWGTTEYANFVVAWIKQLIPEHEIIIWVGHSFGGRIGLHIAATELNLLQGLFLIASSGIPVPKNIYQKMVKTMRIYVFKFFKRLGLLIKNNTWLDQIKQKFGSVDYRNASPLMRNILVKVINEDLSNLINNIDCPTELVYGLNDYETPAIIGKKLHKIIKKSKLHLLPNQDHYSLINQEIHIIKYLLKNFINRLQPKE